MLLQTSLNRSGKGGKPDFTGLIYPPDETAQEFEGIVIPFGGTNLRDIDFDGIVYESPLCICICDRILSGDTAIYRIHQYGEVVAMSKQFTLASGKLGRTIYLSSFYQAAAGPHSQMLELPKLIYSDLAVLPLTINVALTPIEQIKADKNFIMRPAFDLYPRDMGVAATWMSHFSESGDANSLLGTLECKAEGKNSILSDAVATRKGSVLIDNRGQFKDVRSVDFTLLDSAYAAESLKLAQQFVTLDAPIAIDQSGDLLWLGWRLHNNGSFVQPRAVSTDPTRASAQIDNVRIITMGAVKL